MAPTIIKIQLSEQISLPNLVINTKNRVKIDEIIRLAKDAEATRTAARIEKVERKDNRDAECSKALAALLDAPMGLTKSELIAASDSDCLSSLVIRINNKLKSENIYTLKKFTKDGIMYYRLNTIA